MDNINKSYIIRKALEEQLKGVEENHLEQVEKMTKLEKLNAKVVDVGLYYNGHYKKSLIRFTFDLSNGRCASVSLDPRNCPYDMLFDDIFEVETENEGCLDSFKNKPCCCWFDENRKLLYISNFLDDDKMISLEDK